jgi:hypothetical protein
VLDLGHKPEEFLPASNLLPESKQTLMARQILGGTLLSMSLSEILQDLPRLTEAERQELREVLDSYDPERERAWAQLAKERLRAIKAGERKTVDGDEVLAEGRRLAQKQAQQ